MAEAATRQAIEAIYRIERSKLIAGLARMLRDLDAAEELASFLGYIQGGAIVSLADYAFAAASNSRGKSALALTLSFNFVGVVRPGPRLVAEALEEKLGRRTVLYKLEVKLANGTLVASGQGLAYLQDPPSG